MTATLINIKGEQEKVKEQIKAQGLRVLVCAGTGCVANGSLKVIEKFKELGVNVRPMTHQDKVTIVPTGCHGFCEQGVLVVIPDLDVTYVKVKLEDVEEIVESHIKEANRLKDFFMLTLKHKNTYSKMRKSISTQNKQEQLLQTAVK